MFTLDIAINVFNIILCFLRTGTLHQTVPDMIENFVLKFSPRFGYVFFLVPN